MNSATSFESNSSGNESDTSSMKAAFQEKVKKCDRVYGMLDTYKRRFDVGNKIESHSSKLMERMELDRPILQREKFEMIFLEKISVPAKI